MAKTYKVNVMSSLDRGHFRAGRHWPHESTVAEVTEAAFFELKGDPRLLVTEVLERPGEQGVQKR